MRGSDFLTGRELPAGTEPDDFARSLDVLVRRLDFDRDFDRLPRRFEYDRCDERLRNSVSAKDEEMAFVTDGSLA